MFVHIINVTVDLEIHCHMDHLLSKLGAFDCGAVIVIDQTNILDKFTLGLCDQDQNNLGLAP